jgi:hypothetical protein
MMRQVTLLIVLFYFLGALNIALLNKMNRIVQKNKKIHVILDELEYFANAPKKPNYDALASDEADLSDEERIKKDPRIAYLKSFFRKYDSELYDQAEYIVDTADKYNIDYRLIPAIAMQESNLCKVIPPGSHNCWGWGIYGGKITRFASYTEAIDAVSKGLKKGYVDQGLTTPDQIMAKYNPSSDGSWAHGVNFFWKIIE